VSFKEKDRQERSFHGGWTLAVTSGTIVGRGKRKKGTRGLDGQRGKNESGKVVHREDEGGGRRRGTTLEKDIQVAKRRDCITKPLKIDLQK